MTPEQDRLLRELHQKVSSLESAVADAQAWGWPAGRIVAVDGREELYLFADDGTVRHIPDMQTVETLQAHRVASAENVRITSEQLAGLQRMQQSGGRAHLVADPGFGAIYAVDVRGAWHIPNLATFMLLRDFGLIDTDQIETLPAEEIQTLVTYRQGIAASGLYEPPLSAEANEDGTWIQELRGLGVPGGGEPTA